MSLAGTIRGWGRQGVIVQPPSPFLLPRSRTMVWLLLHRLLSTRMTGFPEIKFHSRRFFLAQSLQSSPISTSAPATDTARRWRRPLPLLLLPPHLFSPSLCGCELLRFRHRELPRDHLRRDRGVHRRKSQFNGRLPGPSHSTPDAVITPISFSSCLRDRHCTADRHPVLADRRAQSERVSRERKSRREWRTRRPTVGDPARRTGEVRLARGQEWGDRHARHSTVRRTSSRHRRVDVAGRPARIPVSPSVQQAPSAVLAVFLAERAASIELLPRGPKKKPGAKARVEGTQADQPPQFFISIDELFTL